MRWVVGDRAITGSAGSASQMGRFETKWLSRLENLAALADLPGQWIDKVQQRRPPKMIELDMDSSESPTYGEQEGSAYNGHFGCTCYHPLFVFNQSSPARLSGVKMARLINGSTPRQRGSKGGSPSARHSSGGAASCPGTTFTSGRKPRPGSSPMRSLWPTEG
jgi:hypothetical protein